MLRLKLLIPLLILTIASTGAKGYEPIDVFNIHITDRTQYLSNPDDLISTAAADSINAMFARVWAETSAEPVAVVIGSMAPGQNIDDFATAIFDLWKIGKKDKDNGILILAAIDNRRIAIRTGYGVEGLLPDGVCGEIRDAAISYFRQQDYSQGMVVASRLISDILLDPDARDEIMSAYASDARSDNTSASDMLRFMLWLGIAALIGLLIWILITTINTRRKNEQERYRRLFTIRPVSLFLTFIGLGIPVIAYIICSAMMRHIREHRRSCPNCGNPMHKLDEEHDNDYLTPAQDLEERLNSIDYDVWLCDSCGECDVTPYVNRQSSYTVCPDCGARTMALSGTRIIAKPTPSREGRGERIYSCRNCRHSITKPYTIAKTAPPVVIIPGGGRGFGGGGGGFSGGSFGGGMTGGGGASGGW